MKTVKSEVNFEKNFEKTFKIAAEGFLRSRGELFNGDLSSVLNIDHETSESFLAYVNGEITKILCYPHHTILGGGYWAFNEDIKPNKLFERQFLSILGENAAHFLGDKPVPQKEIWAFFEDIRTDHDLLRRFITCMVVQLSSLVKHPQRDLSRWNALG